MILQRIQVLNYKCLRYIDQELKSFQILVGPNASGKSTFLDVLVFLQDLLRDGLQKAVEKRARTVRELIWKMEDDAFEIAVEFRLSDSVQQQQKEPYGRIRYEIRVGTDQEGVLSILLENLWLIRENGRQDGSHKFLQQSLFPVEPQPPESIVRPPKKRTPPGWRKVMSRTEDGRLYVRSETTDWNFPLTVERDRTGLIFIPAEKERFPASAWLRSILEEGLQFLILNSQAMRWPCRPDAPRTFQPDGSNLPLVVGNLDSKQLNRWVSHLQTILPEIATVKVKEREEDRFRYLVVKTQNGLLLPSWLLSDGTLRLFALTLLAYIPQGKIYMVEEPENGIHPRALEAVYQSLSSIYEGQILCATHSPILLNIAELHELLCFARTESGATDIVPGDRHPRLQEWKKSVPLGDLLASGILG